VTQHGGMESNSVAKEVGQPRELQNGWLS